MNISLAKRLATAALALGLAGGTFGLSTATAFASPAVHVDAAKKTTSAKKTTPGKTTTPGKKVVGPTAGSACTKAELGKTAKSGKTTLACEKAGKGFKWVAKAPAKTKAKPVAKKTAKTAKK